MAKDTKNAVKIDNVEYNFDDMTDKQKFIVQHIMDLERKIGSAQFNLDQLNIGKNAAFAMLKNSLVAAKAIAEANAEEQNTSEAAPTVQ